MKKLKFLLLNALLLIPLSMFAQQTVRGIVTDGNGEILPGVGIIIKGTDRGTSTDFDGKYELTRVNEEDILVFSYMGFNTKEIVVKNNTSINVTLIENTQALEEVVVIGYGTAKKEDLTGTADLITDKSFNKGPSSSPQELISGKIAGVSISSNSGAPGEGQNINIRGLGSLSLTSQPLIVVDGIPLNEGGVGGTRNPLNMINPNDIASMTVLKDASATSIYGSRAANGVIMITTKKGKNTDFKFNFNSSTSVSSLIKKVDVLPSSKFREIVNNSTNDTAKELLGKASTNWQELIYNNALGSDNSFSAMGNAWGVPLRASVGYSNKDGILRKDNFERYTASLNLNPKFLDNHLKFDINARGMYTENTFGNRGAIGSAVAFDPTQNVYDANSKFGGYFTWTQDNGYQINLAPTNPMALLNLVNDSAEIRRFIGNIKADYNLPFFEDITLTVNVGLDKSNSHGRKVTSELIPTSDPTWNGSLTNFKQEATNKLFDAYITYNKEITKKHNINLVLGHSYQAFEFDNYSYDSELEEDGLNYKFIDKSKNVLLSYFGRLNYDFDGKYLLTATLRADASSKLNPKDRWGYFPSLALAWNVHKENFMEDGFFNELKLRLGYGQVGNVNGLGDYLFLTRYVRSQQTAGYQLGNNFLNTFRPEPENKNLTWEIGSTFNVGIDYAFLDRRIKGSLNAYIKKTKDLIAYTFVDPFTNFGNKIDKNIGDMENKGIELAITATPLKTDNFEWDVNYNISVNSNKITRLPDQQLVGNIAGGTDNTIQTHLKGKTPYSFYVYQQVYDKNGKPIEGAYVDRDDNGIINDKDRYIYKNPYADVLMGLSSNASYKNWDFSIATRASIGNYVYNNVASNNGYFNRIITSLGSYLQNIHSDYLKSGFQKTTDTNLQSDYYISNASFFKIDNITLGYSLPEGFINKTNLRIYGSLQNVATFTKYKGLDPEITGGIDNDFYPRPRTFVLGVNLDF